MTLYDLLLDCLDDKDKLTNILIQLDSWLKYLHNHGFCVYDFDPKKIILENNKLTFNSFRYVINNIFDQDSASKINIFQNCKIGLFAYNNVINDGNMNQEHFTFLQENLEKFNQNGLIPDSIFEYYEEIFKRLNVVYMNDYLVKKQTELNGNTNTNVRRKSLATNIGRAYVNDDNAYVNVLLLPTLLTLIYLIGLFVYVFIV